MANVVGKYPDLLYAPIEVKGDAEVHALSRCQMILTEAKKRVQAEFEGVMDRTGLSVERIRKYEAKHPEGAEGDLFGSSSRIRRHGGQLCDASGLRQRTGAGLMLRKRNDTHN